MADGAKLAKIPRVQRDNAFDYITESVHRGDWDAADAMIRQWGERIELALEPRVEAGESGLAGALPKGSLRDAQIARMRRQGLRAGMDAAELKEWTRDVRAAFKNKAWSTLLGEPDSAGRRSGGLIDRFGERVDESFNSLATERFTEVFGRAPTQDPSTLDADAVARLQRLFDRRNRTAAASFRGAPTPGS